MALHGLEQPSKHLFKLSGTFNFFTVIIMTKLTICIHFNGLHAFSAVISLCYDSQEKIPERLINCHYLQLNSQMLFNF